MTKWRTQIASLPDKDFVVVEIYYEDEQWAEISQENGRPLITMFSPIGSQYWELDVDEVLHIINHAKGRLLGESS